MTTSNRIDRFGPDRGVAAVEFAIMLPVLMLMALGAWPLLDVMRVSEDLNRAVGEGVRYATKARANPHDDPDGCGPLTRRVTVTQIEDQVRQASAGRLGTLAEPAGTVTVLLDSVPVTGHATCDPLPGARLRVEALAERGRFSVSTAATGVVE